MKRAPEPGDESSQPETEDWLREWEDENRLSPEAAHDMLRSTFTERLAAWRANHQDADSWVIPFHYTHERGDNMRPIGALWIPDDDVQNLLTNVGSYPHMSAVMDMESSLYGTGVDIAPFQICTIMDTSTDIPVVHISRDMMVGSMRREQVEADFNVHIVSF